MTGDDQPNEPEPGDPGDFETAVLNVPRGQPGHAITRASARREIKMTATAPGDPDYTAAAIEAMCAALDAEHDFAEWLASILVRVAARAGSTGALTAGRPGSWEASLVDQLTKGTCGWEDEYLNPERTAAP